jgi:hypothetical protein
MVGSARIFFNRLASLQQHKVLLVRDISPTETLLNLLSSIISIGCVIVYLFMIVYCLIDCYLLSVNNLTYGVGRRPITLFFIIFSHNALF